MHTCSSTYYTRGVGQGSGGRYHTWRKPVSIGGHEDSLARNINRKRYGTEEERGDDGQSRRNCWPQFPRGEGDELGNLGTPGTVWLYTITSNKESACVFRYDRKTHVIGVDKRAARQSCPACMLRQKDAREYVSSIHITVCLVTITKARCLSSAP